MFFLLHILAHSLCICVNFPDGINKVICPSVCLSSLLFERTKSEYLTRKSCKDVATCLAMEGDFTIHLTCFRFSFYVSKVCVLLAKMDQIGFRASKIFQDVCNWLEKIAAFPRGEFLGTQVLSVPPSLPFSCCLRNSSSPLSCCNARFSTLRPSLTR